MPDDVSELPPYARPPGSGHVSQRGVYVEDGKKGHKMAKSILKVAKVIHHFKPKPMRRRKIKRFF